MYTLLITKIIYINSPTLYDQLDVRNNGQIKQLLSYSYILFECQRHRSTCALVTRFYVDWFNRQTVSRIFFYCDNVGIHQNALSDNQPGL